MHGESRSPPGEGRRYASLLRMRRANLAAKRFSQAARVAVPRVIGTRRVPNGQEVISVVGGLELNTPVWANEMHEYPYLQWQMEVHRAKLKASYPHAADKIQAGRSQSPTKSMRARRAWRPQGLPTTHPGDALFNLVTFSRTWIRPWSFYAIEDEAVRDALLALFPDGCYCGVCRRHVLRIAQRIHGRSLARDARASRRRAEPAVAWAIRWCKFRSATTRSPTFRRKHTSTASRRFTPIRRCSISTRSRIKPPSPPRIIRRARRPGSRWPRDFFSPRPRKCLRIWCGTSRI